MMQFWLRSKEAMLELSFSERECVNSEGVGGNILSDFYRPIVLKRSILGKKQISIQLKTAKNIALQITQWDKSAKIQKKQLFQHNRPQTFNVNSQLDCVEKGHFG